jgi:hypothetical protein
LPGRGADLKLGYRIQVAWPAIVGEMMARFLFPVDVSGATLTIGVTSAVWMQEAEYMQDMLLANVEKALGSRAIRKVMFRMLPGAPRVPAAEAAWTPPPAPELTPAQAEHLEAELSKIPDERLREQMRRILTRALGRS